MSRLFRYVAREVLLASLTTAAALLGLFSFFDFIGEMSASRAPGYTPLKALAYVALNLPVRLYELMPVAVLIGSLLAWNRLALASEFSVMRAAGLSMYRLMAWMLSLGMVIGAATLLLGEYVVPHAEQTARHLKASATTGVVARGLKTGLWARDGNTFINIHEMLPDNSLREVRLYAFDRDFRLLGVHHAAKALWVNGHWRLETVTETTLSGDRTFTAHVPDRVWATAITPEFLSVLMVPPESMSIATLLAYVEHLSENRQDARRYEIALWNKMIYPAAAPVMLLLALVFAYRPPRSGGVGGRLLTGVLLGLGFHLINRLLAQVSQLLDGSASAAAIVPVVLFALAAAMGVWWQERR